MLKVWVKGFRKDCKKDPNGYFDQAKKYEWFAMDKVRDIIKRIDNTIVKDGESLISPVLGCISPDKLSSGCKCLILMLIYPTRNIYASRCGDNCSSLILELAKDTDLIVTLHHCMRFPPDEEYDIFFLDSGVVTHNYREYVREFYRLYDE